MVVTTELKSTRKTTSGSTTIQNAKCHLKKIVINDAGQKCIIVIKDDTTIKHLFMPEYSMTVGKPKVLKIDSPIATSLKVEMTKLDPVLLLKFNNNSTVLAEDLSGSNSDATLYNLEAADRTEDAERGKSLNFSGTNEYATFAGNIANFARTEPFSVSLWINQTTQANYPNPIVHYNGTTGWYIYISPTGGLTFSIVHAAGGNITVYAAAGTIVAGTWTHLTVTYDGNSLNTGMNMYIDGSDAAAGRSGSALTGTTTFSGVCEIARGNAGSYYIGKLDEIMIFDRELSVAEAEYLYRNGYGYAAVDGVRLADITLIYED